MSTFRIPIDGLLRCLCPSLGLTSTIRTTRAIRAPRRLLVASVCRSAKSFIHTTPSNYDRLLRQSNGLANRSESHESSTRSAVPRVNHAEIGALSNDRLHDKLRQFVTEADSYHKICDLVAYLISVRREQPSLIHYDSLIRANSDAQFGSANAVRVLLKEMQENGVGMDSRLYHGVLQVLAIHPDYLLRMHIMDEMKERWFGLSPEGWHNLVIGLLRDRQYEVAMDKLDQMLEDQIIVQPWLYDIFMFQLVEIEEYDEAFKLLVQRWETSRSAIQQSVWYSMLDAFGKVLHYDGIKFIWDKRVEQTHMTPSDGMCGTALNIAARHADPQLGTSAVRILATRAALAPYHYEALIEAYTRIGDLKTAFRILSIMAKANLDLDESNTRFLHLHCMQGTEVREKAWEVLTKLYEEGHTIPLTAVHVVLETCMRDKAIDQGIKFYKKLHEIVETGPNTTTFNTLLRGLSKVRGKKDLAMFLASEMGALGIPANEITYDRLILVCLKGVGDYEDAFRYLEEMISEGERKNEGEGWWMRWGTAEEMVKVCVAAGDRRVWEILRVMEEREMNPARLKVWVEENLNGKRGHVKVAGQDELVTPRAYIASV